MADPVTTPSAGTPAPASTPASAASPAPAGQPAAGEFKMPEKFASAKPEDIAKAYVELEKKYGETSGKLGTLSEYEKLGKANELGEALTWARDVYQRIQRGEYVPKAASGQPAAPAASAAGSQAPWQAEGWEFLPAPEQAAKIADYTRNSVQAAVLQEVQKYAQQYGNIIEQTRATQAREQSLMLKTLQAAMKSGGKVDIQAALEKASELAARTPEELIELAVSNLVNPEDQKAEIERQVTARLAEELQKRSNDELASLSRTASPTPRFATKVFPNRNEENASILKQWAKEGISF